MNHFSTGHRKPFKKTAKTNPRDERKLRQPVAATVEVAPGLPASWAANTTCIPSFCLNFNH